jgi:bacillithiol biosynthesis cysteine-adding enzyme BshC
MLINRIKRNELNQFGNIAQLLGNEQASLIPLIDLPFFKENFKAQIKRKSDFPNERREILVQSIVKQYTESNLEIPAKLALLRSERCFTICTGHQLNLFTGPLYTIYKIVHIIKLAEQINIEYPDFYSLPIFWLASEDHDLDEVNHFQIGEQKVHWNANQSGPVGRMTLNNWESWQEELIKIYPNHKNKLKDLFQVYRGGNMAEATRRLFHFLFKNTPLIILDGDEAALKQQFIPLFEKEILTQFAHKASRTSSEILHQKGLKPQALVREINIFSLDKNSRTRLEVAGSQIKIGEEYFEKNQILEKIRENPEQFSPNVILRPLYQETILPNLCYVGGAGELAYWLQLKPIFDAADTPLPLLQMRFSAQVITNKQTRNIASFGYSFTQFSQPIDDILKNKLAMLRNRNIESEQLKILTIVNQLRDLMLSQALQVDQTLTASAEARIKNIEKQLLKFEEKLTRNERKIHSDILQRIKQLHEIVFPNNSLQERTENFISAYLESRGQLIEFLLDSLSPFEDEFLIIEF